MTTSNRRTQANKQNALQSTGLLTAASKAAISGNAVQYGMLSRHLILPGESRNEFDALLQQLMTEQQPLDALEKALVKRMEITLWRQRRLVAIKTVQLQLQQAELTYPEPLLVRQISGVDDLVWIKVLARESLLAVDLEVTTPEGESHKILGAAPPAGASRTAFYSST